MMPAGGGAGSPQFCRDLEENAGLPPPGALGVSHRPNTAERVKKGTGI